MVVVVFVPDGWAEAGIGGTSCVPGTKVNEASSVSSEAALRKLALDLRLLRPRKLLLEVRERIDALDLRGFEAVD